MKGYNLGLEGREGVGGGREGVGRGREGVGGGRGVVCNSFFITLVCTR